MSGTLEYNCMHASNLCVSCVHMHAVDGCNIIVNNNIVMNVASNIHNNVYVGLLRRVNPMRAVTVHVLPKFKINQYHALQYLLYI